MCSLGGGLRSPSALVVNVKVYIQLKKLGTWLLALSDGFVAGNVKFPLPWWNDRPVYQNKRDFMKVFTEQHV